MVQAVRDELRRERIPVLHFERSRAKPSSSAWRSWALCAPLGTRKVALLRRRGGFRPLAGKRGDAQLSVEGGRISIINLTTERERGIGPGTLSKRDSELLLASDRLIQLGSRIRCSSASRHPSTC